MGGYVGVGGDVEAGGDDKGNAKGGSSGEEGGEGKKNGRGRFVHLAWRLTNLLPGKRERPPEGQGIVGYKSVYKLVSTLLNRHWEEACARYAW